MIEAKTRDNSVDFAKGVAMVAVSFAHIMPFLYGNVDVVSKFCCSFELALFFIVSGYLQFGRTERKPMDYIKHSAASLLYPYFTFTVLIFFVDSILNILVHGSGQYMREISIRICSIITWGAGACWFFPAFFISGIIAYFCRNNKRIPIIIQTVFLIMLGSVMSAFSDKYDFFKEVTDISIVTAEFWGWHIFNLISKSIVGASLILIGYILKKYTLSTPPDGKLCL